MESLYITRRMWLYVKYIASGIGEEGEDLIHGASEFHY